jgi:hypothetical protein
LAAARQAAPAAGVCHLAALAHSDQARRRFRRIRLRRRDAQDVGVAVGGSGCQGHLDPLLLGGPGRCRGA